MISQAWKPRNASNSDGTACRGGSVRQRSLTIGQGRRQVDCHDAGWRVGWNDGAGDRSGGRRLTESTCLPGLRISAGLPGTSAFRLDVCMASLCVTASTIVRSSRARAECIALRGWPRGRFRPIYYWRGYHLLRRSQLSTRSSRTNLFIRNILDNVPSLAIQHVVQATLFNGVVAEIRSSGIVPVNRQCRWEQIFIRGMLCHLASFPQTCLTIARRRIPGCFQYQD